MSTARYSGEGKVLPMYVVTGILLGYCAQMLFGESRGVFAWLVAVLFGGVIGVAAGASIHKV